MTDEYHRGAAAALAPEPPRLPAPLRRSPPVVPLAAARRSRPEGRPRAASPVVELVKVNLRRFFGQWGDAREMHRYRQPFPRRALN